MVSLLFLIPALHNISFPSNPYLFELKTIQKTASEAPLGKRQGIKIRCNESHVINVVNEGIKLVSELKKESVKGDLR